MQLINISWSHVRLMLVAFLTCTAQVTIPAASSAVTASEKNSTILSEEQIKGVEQLFGKIHETCNEIACLLRGSQIKATKEERAQYMQMLVEVRGVLQMIQQTLYSQPRKEVFSHIYPLIHDLILYLQEMIKNGFVGTKSFEPTDRRGVKPEIYSDETIASLIQDDMSLMSTIQKESETASLSLLNRAFRSTLAKPIDELFIKRKGHWWLVAAGITTVLAAYGWYHLSDATYGLPTDLGGMTPNGVDHCYAPDAPFYKQWAGAIFEKWNYGVRWLMGWPMRERSSLRHAQEHRHGLAAIADFKPSLNIEHLALNDEQKEAMKNAVQEISLDLVANYLRGMDPSHAKDLTRPVKLFGHVEHFAQNATHGGAWVGGILTGLAVKHGIMESLWRAKEKIDYWITKAYAKAMGGAFYEQFNNQSHGFQIEPRFTFDDVIGNDHAKQALLDVIKYLENPEKYLRSGLKPITTILLYGDTRTGKTMLVEAFVGEVRKIKQRDDIPVYKFSAHHITSNVFEFIMNNVVGPCVVFIDEFDLLETNRDTNSGTAKQLAEILNTLGESKNSAPDKPIIFIAACNTPGKMDRPLLERFTLPIPFEKPSFEHRLIYLHDRLMKKGLSFHPMEIQAICSLTNGLTYEKIADIIEITCFRKSGSGLPVTMQDIIDTLNTDVHNIIAHDFKALPETEREILSVHMIGHTLANLWAQDPHEQLALVTIRPVKNPITKAQTMQDATIHYGDIICSNMGDTIGFEDQTYYKAKCMQKLAGPIAEEVVLGKQHTTKYSCSCTDKAHALQWAKKYCLNGLDEAQLQDAKELKEKLAVDAHAFMSACQDELRQKMQDSVDCIRFMAHHLIEQESLDTMTVTLLLGAYPKVKAGIPLAQAMQETYAEFEQQLQAMQQAQAADNPDATTVFNH